MTSNVLTVVISVVLFTNVPGQSPQESGMAVHAQWSPDGSSIAYYFRDDGVAEVFVTTLPDGPTTQITFDHEYAANPSFSSDGSRLVMTRRVDDNWDVYVYDLASREQSRLTETAAREMHPGWSPDGRWISFVRWVDEDHTDVFVLGVETGHERRLTTTELNEFHPKWSPDSRFLVVDASSGDSTGGVFRISVAPDASASNSEPERIVDNPTARTPSITPDGERLVYIRQNADGESWSIRIRNLETGSTDRLTSKRVVGAPVVSPDGTSIAFHAALGPDREPMRIIVHDLDAGSEYVLPAPVSY